MTDWITFWEKMEKGDRSLLLASFLTLLALLWLPMFGLRDGSFFVYRWISEYDPSQLHWQILAIELIVIWGGYFLWRSLTKPKSD